MRLGSFDFLFLAQAAPDRHSERSIPTLYSFPEIGLFDLRVGMRSRRISLRRRQNL